MLELSPWPGDPHFRAVLVSLGPVDLVNLIDHFPISVVDLFEDLGQGAHDLSESPRACISDLGRADTPSDQLVEDLSTIKA